MHGLLTMGPGRLLWMAGQAWLVGLITWKAVIDPDPGMPRAFFVPAMFVTGMAIALALTVAWVLVFQLFRYRLPALVRRVVEQVKGRHPLRG